MCRERESAGPEHRGGRRGGRGQSVRGLSPDSVAVRSGAVIIITSSARHRAGWQSSHTGVSNVLFVLVGNTNLRTAS